ncbi:MAG TPA: NADH-quinone oxidoreductase subunit C [Dehalococcoidia bacterium]|nr:NADH-quinone oxidoreductase subunit C [Dehalococcoidia bacterium]
MTTVAISGFDVAGRLNAALPGIVTESDSQSVTVPSDRVVEVALFLRDDEELDAKYLNTLLGVDWLDHFDVVYVISSLAKNHTLVLKARVSHDMPIAPSVNSVWMGANLQEREVYDLMGIAFTDHPNLNRIFLWDGFPGHPLRKDFLALPGGYKPGLQRFPFEFPEGQRGYGALRDTETPTAPEVPRLAGKAVAAGEVASGGQLGALGGGVHGARSPESRGLQQQASTPQDEASVSEQPPADGEAKPAE